MALMNRPQQQPRKPTAKGRPPSGPGGVAPKHRPIQRPRPKPVRNPTPKTKGGQGAVAPQHRKPQPPRKPTAKIQPTQIVKPIIGGTGGLAPQYRPTQELRPTINIISKRIIGGTGGLAPQYRPVQTGRRKKSKKYRNPRYF